MIQSNDSFNKYKRLLESITWQMFTKFHLPHDHFDDLQSIAYLAFCKTVEKFDAERNLCFSTYLYPNVKGYLMDYCNKQIKKVLSKEIYKEIEWFDRQTFFEIDRKINMEMLSSDAKEVVKYILSWEWNNNGDSPRRPTKKSVKEKFNWQDNRLSLVWQEIREWWNKEALYG